MACRRMHCIQAEVKRTGSMSEKERSLTYSSTPCMAEVHSKREASRRVFVVIPSRHWSNDSARCDCEHRRRQFNLPLAPTEVAASGSAFSVWTLPPGCQRHIQRRSYASHYMSPIRVVSTQGRTTKLLAHISPTSIGPSEMDLTSPRPLIGAAESMSCVGRYLHPRVALAVTAAPCHSTLTIAADGLSSGLDHPPRVYKPLARQTRLHQLLSSPRQV